MRSGRGALLGATVAIACITQAKADTMNFFGAWSSSRSYSVGNVVTYANQTYYAVTASLNSVPSPTNAAWRLIAIIGMDYKGTWSATATYQLGAVVRVGSQVFYSLKSSNTNQNPVTQTAYWAPIGTIGNTLRFGTGAPAPTVGVVGDFYINTTAKTIYGPKGATGWPGAATSLVGPQGPKGAMGATGPEGAIGPVGPVGPTGPQGNIGPRGFAGADGQIGPKGPTGATGADGVQGEQGPPGPTLYKRVVFESGVLAAGQNFAMASLTFTPSVTGKAIVSSRGQCAIGPAAVPTFFFITAAESLATLQYNSATSAYIYQPIVSGPAWQSFSSEQEFDVVADTETTYTLYSQSYGGAGASCYGTFKVEVFTGTLQ